MVAVLGELAVHGGTRWLLTVVEVKRLRSCVDTGQGFGGQLAVLEYTLCCFFNITKYIRFFFNSSVASGVLINKNCCHCC